MLTILFITFSNYLNTTTSSYECTSNLNNYTRFCSICQEDQKNTVFTDCMHFYCQECITEYTKINQKCPNCNLEINNLNKIEFIDISIELQIWK